MGRDFLVVLLSSVIFVPFLSCSSIKAMSFMAIGNYKYIRGDYQGAISIYYSFADDKQSSAWSYYNLGIVYYSLGEYESSLRMFSYAKRDSDLFLNFNINYNEGVIYYNQGLYRKAEIAFKEALRINPSSYNAKYNLELAIIKKRTIPDNLENLNIKRNQSFIENNENFLRYVENLERVLWVMKAKEQALSLKEDW
ncbi:tetratricopeptide repeat protein [Borrelia miyamotoi]|uniref:Tetratricopeptide repeat protein n=1 Tax=Borrelia miyamotoi TaxID=47466 RepID=A0AAX3JN48_9SPIR|nr:tetratricopeptide repeat protein [Borrelia miyamotoi]QFP42138.1 tetratricopeptide repeat protein [Borrelia miyamotoi]QFP48253.1 tetratricopeptide repeat protein [Borrelia miyamotoi]QGT56012.1 tetratricopeptide repeat protein [Borrelia miyamotoi]QGT56793.1 tetratricopeptide repeat protein [Borrelia miyamotoi]WAZ72055.1 tetratricopeptide repeat protein [Borrelia miyamotoi]